MSLYERGAAVSSPPTQYLPTGVAQRPIADPIDWQPDMGHVSGAGYEWSYAERQPLAEMPSWVFHAANPLEPLASSVAQPRRPAPGIFQGAINQQSVLGQQGDESFWLTGPGGVLLGAAPGAQRGGALPGTAIATLPVTLANFPMYGREGVVALLDSLLTGGRYIQRPDGTEAPLPEEPNLVDSFVGGLRDVGNAIGGVFDGISNFDRQANAAARITQVADLYLSGEIRPTVIQAMTTWLGAETRFDPGYGPDALGEGHYDEAIGKLNDLPLETVQAIRADPQKYASPLRGVAMLGALAGPGTAAWDLAAGLPYSVDPLVNMATEIGHFGGQIVTGVGALKLGGATLGAFARAATGATTVGRTAQLGGAFTRGVHGLTRAADTSRGAYWLGRTARMGAQAAAINNAAGMTIRGLEWGVKELAILGGNKALADAMDRLLWNMPLSMNPGLNIITSFTSHPIQVGKQVLRGRIPVGRPGTIGEVGVVRPGRLSVVSFADPDIIVTVGGRPLTLIPSAREALGTIRTLDIDGLHAYVLRGTGWDLGVVRSYFGEGSRFEMSTNELRDAVFYTYLQAAREQAGHVASRVPGATLAEVSENFVTRYMPRVLEMLKSDLAGRTTHFADTVRGQFWDFAGREDTAMGRLKAPVGPYSPQVSLAAFASWIRASRTVRMAVEERAARFRLQPRHRQSVNPEGLEWFRRDVLGKYAPEDIVTLDDLNRLKQAGGLIERRGRGRELIAREGEPPDLTRSELEAIIDDVLEKWEQEGERPRREAPYTVEEAEAALAEGKRLAEEAEEVPPGIALGPSSEAADARVTGVSLPTVRLLRETVKIADDQTLRGLQPPSDLLRWFSLWKHLDDGAMAARLAGDRAGLWHEILDAWDARLEEAMRYSQTYHAFARFAGIIDQRAAEGLMNSHDATMVVDAVDAIMANLESPLGPLERYSEYTGPTGEGMRSGDRIQPGYPRWWGDQMRSLVEGTETSPWEMEHPGVYDRWKQAREVAEALARMIDDDLGDPAIEQLRQRWHQVEHIGPDGNLATRAFPTEWGDQQVARLLALANRAARDPSVSPADIAALRDPAIHPLEKRAAILRALADELAPEDRAMIDSVVADIDAADSALASFDGRIEEMVGIVSNVARRLSLEPFGGWSDSYRAAHESVLGLLRADQSFAVELPIARAVQGRKTQLRAHQEASLRVSRAEQELTRLEDARAQVGERRGEWGRATQVARAQGLERAEEALARFRREDPAGSYRAARKGGGWYDIERAERAAGEGQETLETNVPAPMEAAFGPPEAPVAAAPALEAPAAPPAAAAVYGAATSFPDLRVGDVRKKVQARFRLVDVDEIRTSDQPGYPAALQPRDLDQARVNAIAERFDPDAALRTESGAHGAPVVTPDVVAVAGNHRVGGMRQLTPEQWAAYHEAIRARADEFGVPEPAGRQVLVREIMPEDATSDLALALNTETQAMSAGEMARAVARAITPEDLKRLTAGGTVSLDTALTREGNAEFIGRLVGELPPNERARYLDPATGGPTQPAIDLVRDALLMQTLPGQYDLVKGWVEQPATRKSIERIIGGLEVALPQLAEANALIGFGQRPDVLGVTLGEAIRRLKSAREDRAIRPGDMREALRSGIDDVPLAGDLAATLNDLGGASEVTTFLRAVADRIVRDEASDPTAITMFELQATPEASLRMYLDAGVDAVNAERGAKAAGGMFSADVLDHFPDVSGRAHYDYTGPAGEARTMTEQVGTVGDLASREAPDATVLDVRTVAERAAADDLVARGVEAVADQAQTMLRVYDEAARRGNGPDAYLAMVELFDGSPDAATLAVLRELSTVVRFDEQGRFVPAYGRSARAGRASRVDAAIREVSQPPEVPGAPLVVASPRVVPPPPIRDLMGGGEMPNEAAIRQAAGAGRHVITDDTRAARRVAGQPEKRGRAARVSQFNEPDLAASAARLDESITRVRGDVEAARQELASKPPPGGVDPVFSDLDTAQLYERYMRGTRSEAPAPPETIVEVLGALESLDAGFPAADITMTATEAERLAQALYGFVGRYTASRGGGKPPRPPKGPTMDADGPPPPERMEAETRAVIASLARVVLDDPEATPLAGFEGTQYDFGPVPGDPSLGPRLIMDRTEDYIAWADEVIPGLGDELLYGRKQKWAPRMSGAVLRASLTQTIPLAARAGSLLDTAFGARPEKEIVQQAMGRFADEITGGPAEGAQLGLWGGDVRAYEGARAQVEGIVGAIHRFMETQRVGPTPRFSVTQYRRVGLVPDRMIQEIGEKHLRATNKGRLPAYYERFVERTGPDIESPIAEAWRKADNRIRARFAGQTGGAAQLVEAMYGSGRSRGLSSAARGLTVWYHVFRFAFDIRWLGLEAIEAGILTASKEGPGAWLAAHNLRLRNGKLERFKPPKGMSKAEQRGWMPRELMPIGLGEDVLAQYRHDWAWWLQQAESGLAFGRMRYTLAIVKSMQESRLPAILRDVARKDPQIADMLRSFGASEDDWIRELSAMWDLSGDISRRTSPLGRQEVLTAADADRLYRPFLERGIIDDVELMELVKAGRHTPNPHIDAELAKLTDPRMSGLFERLRMTNQTFWNDAASLIFGQADRSNMQRLFNHPLLWWPTSYMVKATRWLVGILFERMAGRDTGALGAYTLAQLHQAHVEAMTDPEYWRIFREHPTLLFIAQMLLPVTPFDIGVSLSPMTRLAMQAGGMSVTGETPEDPYRRNFFSWGPFYTFYSLLPRLVGEEAKVGTGAYGNVMRALETMFPRTFTVEPSSSRLSQAEAVSASGEPALLTPTPDQVPDARYAP